MGLLLSLLFMANAPSIPECHRYSRIVTRNELLCDITFCSFQFMIMTIMSKQYHSRHYHSRIRSNHSWFFQLYLASCLYSGSLSTSSRQKAFTVYSVHSINELRICGNIQGFTLNAQYREGTIFFLSPASHEIRAVKIKRRVNVSRVNHGKARS